jgi:WD40 repeat protein
MGRKISISIAAVVALAAIGLAGWIWTQERAAAEQRYQAALAQKLGAQAQLRLDDTPDPTLGGLLAVESLRRYPSLDGDIAARRGIELLAWRGIFSATNTLEPCALSLSLSADGRRLATLSNDCRDEDGSLELKVWDVDAGREIAQPASAPGDLPAQSVALSPDGRWLVVDRCGLDCAARHQVEVVAVDTGRRVMLAASPGWAFGPACDDSSEAKAEPCDQRMALVEGDTTVAIWDLPAVQVTARLTSTQTVSGVAFSPSGRWLAARGQDKVWVWDVAAGKLAHEITHPSAGLRFSSEGSRLATLGRTDRTVRVWDVDTWREVSQVSDFDAARPYAVEFSPGGEWLSIFDSQGFTRVWYAATGAKVTRVSSTPAGADALAFSPEGERLAVGTSSGAIEVWETGTWRESARIAQTARELAFSADGKRLASRGFSGGVQVWELRPGPEVVKGDADRLALAFSPECDSSPAAPAEQRGCWLAATQGDRGEKSNRIRVLGVATGAEVAQLGPGDAWLTSLVFSPEGRRIIAGDDAGTLYTWDVTTGREITRTALGAAAADILAFSPDRRLMLSSSESLAEDKQVVTLWDVAAGREIDALETDRLGEVQAAFGPDGRWVALGHSKTVVLWDVMNAPHDYEILTSNGQPLNAWQVTFSPNGRLLAASGGYGSISASAGYERTFMVRVWDVATRQEIKQLPHDFSIAPVAFSPDSSLLVAGTAEWTPYWWEGAGTVRVWDTTTWREVVSFDSGQVAGLSVSPGSRWIAVGAVHGARIWEARTGREVARIPDRDAFSQPLFSPNGRWLVTVGEDHFSVWAWQPADLIAQACARLTRNLTRAEWRLYLGDEPYRATCPNLPVAEDSK